jgi:hypothetical protein
VRYCASKGRLLVAAAGNDGCAECLHVPGALPSVLTVGATEPDGKPLAHSNWGKAYQSQGIVAPGRNVVVASPGDVYALGTGTSLATPLVSGVAALLASLQRRYVRRVDLSAVRQILLAAATGCDEQPTDQCERLLVGRLNIARAHAYLLKLLKGLSMTSSAEPVIDHPVVASPASEPSAPVPTAFVAPSIAPGVVPADCGCGGSGNTGQYVYAIGDRIGYDFGSRVRQFSLQSNAANPDPNDTRTLSDTATFLRYLLGSRRFGAPFNGNLHDAKSVYWVLYRDNCPLYAVQPIGDFSEALYKALITFLIETTDFGFYTKDPAGPLKKGDPIPFTDPDLDIRYECLREYFDCYGGQSEPLEFPPQGPQSPPRLKKELEEQQKLISEFYQARGPKPEGAKPGAPSAAKPEAPGAAPEAAAPLDPLADLMIFMGEAPQRAAKVAIAGTLANKRVTLANAQQVEVIHPDLRGMSTWNTLRLLQVALDYPSKEPRAQVLADAWGFIARVTSRLYELVRNDGKTPQERAINWQATAFLHQVRPLLGSSTFRMLVGGNEGLKAAAVNDIQVRPATCQESGGEYDVELSLFSIESMLRGLTVIASTVDVSDVVPVTLGRTRVFNKRQ